MKKYGFGASLILLLGSAVSSQAATLRVDYTVTSQLFVGGSQIRMGPDGAGTARVEYSALSPTLVQGPAQLRSLAFSNSIAFTVLGVSLTGGVAFSGGSFASGSFGTAGSLTLPASGPIAGSIHCTPLPGGFPGTCTPIGVFLLPSTSVTTPVTFSQPSPSAPSAGTPAGSLFPTLSFLRNTIGTLFGAPNVFAQLTFTEVGRTFIPDIDIKPGGPFNAINLSSQGLVPVAILGSDSFDVADVDVTTLAFGPGGAAPAHAEGGHVENANGDGFLDLVSHYRTQETGLQAGDTEACVTGATLDGTALEGCDAVTPFLPCGIGFELALLLPPLMWLHARRRRSIS